jgi:hypothetical protein
LSSVKEYLEFTLRGLDSIFHIKISRGRSEYSKSSLFSPFIYEVWIASTCEDKAISTFDIPKEQLPVLLNQYNEYIKSKPSAQMLPLYGSEKKNIIEKIRYLLHLYIYEKAPSSLFSSIDIITLDELNRKPLGRTTIELDADVINFIPAQFDDRNLGLLFYLHQYNVALVIQIFRSKSEDLHKWLDKMIRIAKLWSILIGFIGPVLLHSSNNIYNLTPLYYSLSYIAFFIIWYKFAPRIILRLFLRIILKKIIQ